VIEHVYFTPRFKRFLSKLSKEEQEQAREKLELFFSNPRHPPLHSKKIKGTTGIWESRVNDDIRLTWQYYEDGILLRVIGHGDEALEKP
jgi:mRNA interferase RelE/StbE